MLTGNGKQESGVIRLDFFDRELLQHWPGWYIDTDQVFLLGSPLGCGAIHLRLSSVVALRGGRTIQSRLCSSAG